MRCSVTIPTTREIATCDFPSSTVIYKLTCPTDTLFSKAWDAPYFRLIKIGGMHLAATTRGLRCASDTTRRRSQRDRGRRLGCVSRESPLADFTSRREKYRAREKRDATDGESEDETTRGKETRRADTVSAAETKPPRARVPTSNRQPRRLSGSRSGIRLLFYVALVARFCQRAKFSPTSRLDLVARWLFCSRLRPAASSVPLGPIVPPAEECVYNTHTSLPSSGK